MIVAIAVVTVLIAERSFTISVRMDWRVFAKRIGTSEYTINKQTVDLRDNLRWT